MCAKCEFSRHRLQRFKLRARPNGARGFLMRVNPYGTLAPNQEPVEVETEVGGVKVRQGVRPGRPRRRIGWLILAVDQTLFARACTL
jgi:hypothetical protein